MKSTIRKIWDAATAVLVCLVVAFAGLLVGPKLFGLDVYIVLSGSMEPVYSAGDLIYVKEVDPFELEEGTIITFMLSEETIATHRIVEVVPDEEDDAVIRFKTKGDANESEDGGLVHYKNVIGAPIFSVPKLGYVANFIQEAPGTYVAIAAGALILALVFIPDLFGDDEEKSTPKKDVK